MEFRLTGTIYYSVGSCHDDRSITIDEKFSKPTIKTGLKTAREIIKREHNKNRHLTDYSLHAVLEVTKSIWKVDFIDEQSTEPAQPARSAVKAHLKEARIR